jgi:hypothetical protein
MQLCRIIYYFLAALHVSSDIFAHHQEHLNCITASGITHYVAAGWYRGSVVPTLPWYQPAATSSGESILLIWHLVYVNYVGDRQEFHLDLHTRRAST